MMRNALLCLAALCLGGMLPGLYAGALLMAKLGSFYVLPLPCLVLLAIAAFALDRAEGMTE